MGIWPIRFATNCAFTSHGIHDPYGSWKDGRVLSTPPFCLCHHRVPVLMVCEPMATKIDPWSHPSKGYVHPTHGARGNGYLVEMCCLPSCLEDTAPPETGRFARNDRKVIIAPPYRPCYHWTITKSRGRRRLGSSPPSPPRVSLLWIHLGSLQQHSWCLKRQVLGPPGSSTSSTASSVALRSRTRRA